MDKRKLSDNELEMVAGGAGANSRSVEADGIVVECIDNGKIGRYRVQVNQEIVIASPSAWVSVRLKPGDSVRVVYSPDAKQGIITSFSKG